MADTRPQFVNNFHVLASYAALEVLTEDEDFQDLPANWQQIIRKIKDKLVAKEQRARFEEQLTSLVEADDEVKAALPAAIQHLIAALNSSAPPKPSHQPTSDLHLEFSRSYTPKAINSKMPRQQPVKTCGEEERPEERNRHQHRLVPRPVH